MGRGSGGKTIEADCIAESPVTRGQTAGTITKISLYTHFANMYAKLICLHKAEGTGKSPVVFVHGFPDSPAMFAAYYAEAEREQPWLAGRSIYCYAFPNRHDNPSFPPLRELARGVMAREFDRIMDDLARRSPTGKLVFLAHDWGATHTWRWARGQKNPPVEKMVAFSVGSSNRFDVFEHGFNAFTWLYGLWFCAPYYLPFMRRPVARSITQVAGYRSETAALLWKDTYHYWDRPRLLLTILPQALFGLFYRREYLDFTFPVLYLRSPLDRIASTAAFERLMESRPDCRMVLYPGYNHWFPEQHSDVVLPEVRTFIGG
jgi:pimeloyl-ACP methyl ester carboxylesterase